jgi:hypothetical protein
MLGTTLSYVTGENTMYSTLSYQIANTHTADLHQQATRERVARTAARARSAQPHHRTRLLPGRTVTAAAHRVHTRVGGHQPSPTR